MEILLSEHVPEVGQDHGKQFGKVRLHDSEAAFDVPFAVEVQKLVGKTSHPVRVLLYDAYEFHVLG